MDQVFASRLQYTHGAQLQGTTLDWICCVQSPTSTAAAAATASNAAAACTTTHDACTTFLTTSALSAALSTAPFYAPITTSPTGPPISIAGCATCYATTAPTTAVAPSTTFTPTNFTSPAAALALTPAPIAAATVP